MKRKRLLLFRGTQEDGTTRCVLSRVPVYLGVVLTFTLQQASLGAQATKLELMTSRRDLYYEDYVSRREGETIIGLVRASIHPRGLTVLTGVQYILGPVSVDPYPWKRWSRIISRASVHQLPSLERRLPVWSGDRFATCFDRHGTLIAVHQEGRMLDFWNLDKPSIRTVTMSPDSGYQNLSLVCMTASPASDVLAIGFHPGAIELWDWNGTTRLRRLVDDSLGWSRLVFDPTGKYLGGVTVGPPVMLKMFDVESGKLVWTLDLGSRYEIPLRPAIAFSPDGSFLACILNGHVVLVDAEKGAIAFSFPEAENAGALGLGFSPLRNMLAVVYSDGTIQVWDWKKQALLVEHQWKPPPRNTKTSDHDYRGLTDRSERPEGKRLLACGFTPDGRFLVVLSEQQILVYRVE